MRVAAIYDIHGNLPALEAVLEEVRLEGVDEVVVGGDVVPGPMPRECVSALLGLSIPLRFIQGNGEHDVLALHRGEAPARVPQRFHETMRWVARELPAGHLDEMDRWPATTRMTLPDVGEVLFCHATPRDDNELFTRLTPEDRLRPVFSSTGASVVVCGHTHMQFERAVGDVRVVNAGSVGMPFGDPGAYWAMLGPGVELRHTSYDFAGAAQRIRGTRYPLASEFRVEDPAPESEMLELFEAAALR